MKLLVWIDDAPGELKPLMIVESESTFTCMKAPREYIERQGKPVAFYSDRRSATSSLTLYQGSEMPTHQPWIMLKRRTAIG